MAEESLESQAKQAHEVLFSLAISPQGDIFSARSSQSTSFPPPHHARQQARVDDRRAYPVECPHPRWPDSPWFLLPPRGSAHGGGSWIPPAAGRAWASGDGRTSRESNLML